ncbi:MAG: class I SAM-dependent methyltransferase [Acidobacteria bacterium]|nr:class I SAM-dependent methyltransferase [Acidobacteriota bacterium]
MEAHYRLLVRWNERLNLTSIRTAAAAVERHYCESVFAAVALASYPAGTRIMDAGSGAGFPGIPMGIVRPDWQIFLLESDERKGVFLCEATYQLANFDVIPKRLEVISGQFDLLVARAVRPVEVLAAVPRLAPAVAMLLGKDDAAALGTTSSIRWDDPIQLPWGARRYLLHGRVPRETSV